MNSKKWNDQPYYAHEKVDVQKETGYIRPNHDDGLSKIQARMNVRSGTESYLKGWWFREDAKRQKGELNEIDANEIKAASTGVKNKWLLTAKEDPKMIADFAIAFTIDEDKQKINTLWHNINSLRKELDDKTRIA